MPFVRSCGPCRRTRWRRGATLVTQAPIRPSPGSLRKKPRPTGGGVEPDGCGPSQPQNERPRAVLVTARGKRGGTAVSPARCVGRAVVPVPATPGRAKRQQSAPPHRRTRSPASDHLRHPRDPAGLPDGARAPVVPRARARGARLLGRRRHLRGDRRGAPDRGERRQRVRLLRRPAVRQRPAALRPPAHRLRQGRRPALPDDARHAGRAPLRLGLPRPARRVRGREAARHHAQDRDRGDGRRASSTTPAAPPCCATPTSGSDYVTRQARWVDFDNDYKTLDLAYMESVMWAFKTLWDKGLDLRGLPGALVLLALRDAAVEHRDEDGRRLPRPAGSGGHGRAAADARAGRRSCDGALRAGLDDDAVDAAVEPRRRRASGRRVRRGARPTSAASGICSPRPASPRTRASSARRRAVLRAVHGRGAASARATRRRSTSSRAGSQRAPGAGRRLRHDRGRHRHGAHRAGLRRGGQGRHRRGGHRAGHAGELARRVRPPGAAVRRACTSSRRTSRSSEISNGDRGAAAAPRDVRAPVPALLALRQPADPARRRARGSSR